MYLLLRCIYFFLFWPKRKKIILISQTQKELFDQQITQWSTLVLDALFNWDLYRPQTFISNISCFLLAQKSLDTIHLIPWVLPKCFPVLYFLTKPFHVVKVFLKRSRIASFRAPNVLDPRLSLHINFLYLKDWWKIRNSEFKKNRGPSDVHITESFILG